jgi:hypothetical protein
MWNFMKPKTEIPVNVFLNCFENSAKHCSQVQDWSGFHYSSVQTWFNVCLSCLSVCLSVCLSICLSVYLSSSAFICLSLSFSVVLCLPLSFFLYRHLFLTLFLPPDLSHLILWAWECRLYINIRQKIVGAKRRRTFFSCDSDLISQKFMLLLRGALVNCNGKLGL